MIFRQLYDANTSIYTYLIRDPASRQAALIDPNNPRLAGKSRAEFIELMNQLHLPRPARIDQAVPANRACGEPTRFAASACDERKAGLR